MKQEHRILDTTEERNWNLIKCSFETREGSKRVGDKEKVRQRVEEKQKRI